MSNPLKGIGRIFKKVAKVLKKIALPALAIAAVVLTGGAALGALPGVAAGIGGSAAVASSLGISTGLASVITSAGTGALLGGATAAITGKNILKGMATGGLMGAATGGLGQLIKPAASVAQTASTVAKTASTAGSAFSTPISYAATQTPSMGMDSLVQGGMKAATSGGGLGSIVSAGAGAVPNSASAFAPAKTVGINYGSPVTPPESLPYQSLDFGSRTSPELFDAVNHYASMPITPVSTGGSVMGGLGRLVGGINPYIGGELIRGVGGGIMAMQQAKDAKKQDKRDRASYEDTSGYFQPGDFGQYEATDRNWVWAIDETTGRPYKEYR